MFKCEKCGAQTKKGQTQFKDKDGKKICFKCWKKQREKDLKEKKKEIETLERYLRYESRPGNHTFTMCDCNRQGRRRYFCTLCLKESIEKRKEEIKGW